MPRAPVDDDDRLTRLEYAIWGLRGDNGLVSEVRELRKELHGWREEDRQRREHERKELVDERKKDLRWRIGTILSVLALLVSVVVAAQIIASSLG